MNDNDGESRHRLMRRARRLLPGLVAGLMLAWIAFITLLIAGGAKPR